MTARLNLVLYLAGLLISVGTAFVTLHVRNEVAEVRLVILERMAEHERRNVSDYPSRREFEDLRSRTRRMEEVCTR